MTIEAAVQAARMCAPVVYSDPMLGDMLFARIGSVRKDFGRREDAARGKHTEWYSLELLPMNGANSVTVVDPERCRIAMAADLARLDHYDADPSRPPVHEEIKCAEVKRLQQ